MPNITMSSKQFRVCKMYYKKHMNYTKKENQDFYDWLCLYLDHNKEMQVFHSFRDSTIMQYQCVWIDEGDFHFAVFDAEELLDHVMGGDRVYGDFFEHGNKFDSEIKELNK